MGPEHSNEPTPQPAELSNASGYAERCAAQSGRAPSEKLSSISANSGVIDRVNVAVMLGTTIDQVRALPGFRVRDENPCNPRGDRFVGSFDTSGTNLIDAAGHPFVRYIEGPIKMDPLPGSVEGTIQMLEAAERARQANAK